ncbi:MAG TPA: M14 family zinc carboxypeptidase [Leptospiraceae bacterium]|nr:M14 family zinc carboxypeptidase [Leptospiraceae bacterium]
MIRFFLVCIGALWLLRCATTAEATATARKPDIDWTTRYGVLLVDPDEGKYLASRKGSHLADTRPDGTAVTVPAEEAKKRRDRGYRTIQDPPFRYIDPEISTRRKSNDPEVWWSGYKDEEIVEKIVRGLATAYPGDATLFDIGKTHRGRHVLALRLGSRAGIEQRPSFLFDGGHHGNEPLSVEYVLDVMRTLLSSVSPVPGAPVSPVSLSYLEQRQMREYLDNFQIWCVPLVNPDGMNVFWNRSQIAGRRNGRELDGVDLNRNYPFYWNSGSRNASSDRPGSTFYRGPSPGSEPETKAMMNLADRQRFVVSLSYHTFATKVLVPYTTDGAISPVPMTGWRFANELVRAGRSNRPDKNYIAARNLYPVDGTDQDWLHNTYGTLAFIVEGSYQTPEFATGGLASIRGMRPLSLRALSLYANGPTIQVKVLDHSGKPARVRIRRLDQALLEQEHFETHPLTGTYDFILDEPGDTAIQVVFQENGKLRQILRTVHCSTGVCPVTIRLTSDTDNLPW